MADSFFVGTYGLNPRFNTAIYDVSEFDSQNLATFNPLAQYGTATAGQVRALSVASNGDIYYSLGTASNNVQVRNASFEFVRGMTFNANVRDFIFVSDGSYIMCTSAVYTANSQNCSLRRYNSSHSVLWDAPAQTNARSLAFIPSLNLILCAGVPGASVPTTHRFGLLALNLSDGSLSWALQYGATVQTCWAVDAHQTSETVYAGGATADNSDGFGDFNFAKVDSAGNYVWRKMLYGVGAEAETGNFVRTVAVDQSTGDVYAIASRNTRVSRLYKFNSSGTEQWSVSLRLLSPSTTDSARTLLANASTDYIFESEHHLNARLKSDGSLVRGVDSAQTALGGIEEYTGPLAQNLWHVAYSSVNSRIVRVYNASGASAPVVVANTIFSNKENRPFRAPGRVMLAATLDSNTSQYYILSRLVETTGDAFYLRKYMYNGDLVWQTNITPQGTIGSNARWRVEVHPANRNVYAYIGTNQVGVYAAIHIFSASNGQQLGTLAQTGTFNSTPPLLNIGQMFAICPSTGYIFRGSSGTGNLNRVFRNNPNGTLDASSYTATVSNGVSLIGAFSNGNILAVFGSSLESFNSNTLAGNWQLDITTLMPVGATSYGAMAFTIHPTTGAIYITLAYTNPSFTYTIYEVSSSGSYVRDIFTSAGSNIYSVVDTENNTLYVVTSSDVVEPVFVKAIDLATLDELATEASFSTLFLVRPSTYPIQTTQFALATPTNLQTVAAGGNRAIVSWEPAP